VAQDLALECDALNEVSGMETRRRGGFWMLEDSGNGAELFAVGERGNDLGRADIIGVDNEDWEDLSSYTEPSGRRMLLIADTGDNDAERPSVSLISVPEDSAEQALRRGAARAEHVWDIRLPTGAADIESAAVEPGTVRAYLLTKREVPAVLWSMSLGDAHSLMRVGELVLPQPTPAQVEAGGPYAHAASYPTAMDFTDSGEALIVQTYTDAYVVRRDASGGLDLENPERLPVTKLAQTEAGCVSVDGTWWFTSEQRPAPLLHVPIPVVE